MILVWRFSAGKKATKNTESNEEDKIQLHCHNKYVEVGMISEQAMLVIRSEKIV